MPFVYFFLKKLDVIHNLIKKYETRLQLKRYSLNTISSYSNLMLEFVKRFNYEDENLKELTIKQIIRFWIILIQEKRILPILSRRVFGSLQIFLLRMF